MIIFQELQMPKLIFTDSYEQIASKFLKKYPELKSKYIKTLKLLEINPNHPVFRFHKLKGRLSEFYSASIDIQYRITLEFYIIEDKIIPFNVGSHDEIYK